MITHHILPKLMENLILLPTQPLTCSKKLQKIIQYPTMVVPSLSDEAIRVAIIEAVTSYLEKEITLQTLIAITYRLNLFKGMRKHTPLSLKIDNALFAINKLSPYLNSQKENEEKINDVLIKKIEELMKKQDVS